MRVPLVEVGTPAVSGHVGRENLTRGVALQIRLSLYVLNMLDLACLE